MNIRFKIENWRKAIKQVKFLVAKSIKEDYLDGWSIPDIMEKYGITKTVFYAMTPITLEEKLHHSQNMWTKRPPKLGRPKGSKNKPK